MRWLILGVMLAACGSTSANVKTAREARYTGDAAALFEVVAMTVAERYEIYKQTREEYSLRTMPRMYTPEGAPKSGGITDYERANDRNLTVHLEVRLVTTDPSRLHVQITPKTTQHLAGLRSRELAPDDPNVPGWVHGRVDALYVAIHERLHGYAAK